MDLLEDCPDRSSPSPELAFNGDLVFLARRLLLRLLLLVVALLLVLLVRAAVSRIGPQAGWSRLARAVHATRCGRRLARGFGRELLSGRLATSGLAGSLLGASRHLLLLLLRGSIFVEVANLLQDVPGGLEELRGVCIVFALHPAVAVAVAVLVVGVIVVPVATAVATIPTVVVAAVAILACVVGLLERGLEGVDTLADAHRVVIIYTLLLLAVGIDEGAHAVLQLGELTLMRREQRGAPLAERRARLALPLERRADRLRT